PTELQSRTAHHDLPRPRRRASSKEGSSHGATLTGLEPATSAVTGRHANQLRYRAITFQLYRMSDPNGIRTRATAVKGRRPRPLNDGAEGIPGGFPCRRSSISDEARKNEIEGASPWIPGVSGRRWTQLLCPRGRPPSPLAGVMRRRPSVAVV